ncbi:hypothetical protein SNE25_21390 [Mucilaginibacter sabulilitoris]|uniref:Uncharacterized protein n=1 Tax=Mucilaginibacter sabulilitoris TaxID=1173583 RepID=A0ABZ0TFC1_9SPHI|nr:hypothetical protein [Mucilaginibacter sabulilitoris]WPU91874.1 hypothetical protein SNE25_21390 [Mucilaginibacter sabulilitoris]
MKETTDDNFLGSLKSLVWTAFISVVSFQLLAPQIWSYLHNLLRIGYLTAYRSFTLVYFLLAPVSLLTWFFIHHKLLIKYMPPFNEVGKLEKCSRVFIWVFPAFILCQIAVTVWGFYLHWEDFILWTILALYFVINTVLLRLCYQFASSFIEGSGLKKERLDKAKSGFYQSYVFSLLAGLLLFVVAYLFLANWLKRRSDGENKLAGTEAGRFGFGLQQINDTVTPQIHYIDSLVKTDSTIRNWHALEVFAQSGGIHQANC